MTNHQNAVKAENIMKYICFLLDFSESLKGIIQLESNWFPITSHYLNTKHPSSQYMQEQTIVFI